MNRRDFLKASLTGLAAMAIGGAGLSGCNRLGGVHVANAAPETPATQPSASPGETHVSPGIKRKPVQTPCDMAVATGEDIKATALAALEAFGGLEQFVGKDDKVVIKPNLAWARTAEQGANTHPDLLAAILEAIQQIGPEELIVVEHPVDSADVTFEMTGAKQVCDQYRVPLICARTDKMYTAIDYPKGQIITSDAVITDIMTSTVYISLPIAKVHGSSVITCALKNQMGSVWDRGAYHRQGLHQCIADAATGLQPTLNIIDASRILLTSGPKGPGQLEYPNEIFVTTDMVAADVYAAGLLGKKIEQVPHITMAAELGVGEPDLNALQIERVSA
ncbi:MAG: DUF362 domain-containing protein [candidate division WS1 bacterium]|nr:DUF362 domain-containing protein [candidate division WS1 bacterium]